MALFTLLPRLFGYHFFHERQFILLYILAYEFKFFFEKLNSNLIHFLSYFVHEIDYNKNC